MDSYSCLMFIEKCLKKFEYPSIYSADIGEILGGSNRIFLISWLYKLIQGGECPDELPREVLLNFLNAHGFCLSSQTKQFIDMSLDYPSQIQIFHRIFAVLNTVGKEWKSPRNLNEIPLGVITNFVHTDVNIFRSFGSLKISENVSDGGNETSKANLQFLNDRNGECEKIEKLLDMKEKIKHASGIISDILKHKDRSDLTINLDDDSINVLKEFNENISRANEVIRNIQIMSDLKNSVIFDQVVIPEENENEYTGMAKEIIKLIYDI